MAELTISPDVIRDALKDFAAAYEPTGAAATEVGTVVDAADGIAHLEGLPGVMANELIRFADGTLGLALRRFRHLKEAAAFDQPTAAVTRWQVSARPSLPLPVPGIGRARWLLELTRCRAGAAADFDVEATDGEGRIAFSSRLADRSPTALPRSRGATG